MTDQKHLGEESLTSGGSLFLAEALLHEPDLLAKSSKGFNQRSLEPEPSTLPSFPAILELGAGTGFLSIFLSQIGYGRIWSSDVGDDPVGFEGEEGTNEAGGNYFSRLEARFAPDMRRRGPLDGLIANLELSESE